MKALLFTLLIMVSWFHGAAAADGKLDFDLAESRVDITTGFDGTRITAFGTYNRPSADLVITLKGPEGTVTVRQRARVLGAWMNRDSLEFRRVPSYYDYASTMAEDKLASLGNILTEDAIGVDALGFYPENDRADQDEISVFRDALIRSMQERGLYSLRAHDPVLIAPGFFKVSFDLPSAVPTGIYTISAIMIENETITSRQSRTLQVGQVGFNARVYLFAQNYAFLYGLMAVAIALASGWSAFTFLRRD